jgi:hypothetical protein
MSHNRQSQIEKHRQRSGRDRKSMHTTATKFESLRTQNTQWHADRHWQPFAVACYDATLACSRFASISASFAVRDASADLT